MHYFLPGLVLMLMVVGCCPKVVTSTTTSVTDSTHVEYITRDVEVKVPGDSIEIIRWIECDSLTNKPKPFKQKIKSSRIQMTLDLTSKGALSAKCAEDSLKTVIKVMDKELFRLKHESEKKTEVVTEFKTRRIDIICRWIAGIAVLLALIKIYLKFIKPI